MILKQLTIGLVFLCCLATSYATTLSWGTEATYPPFVSIDHNGQFVGLDVDIAHAICKQMKAHCHLTNAPWESLIPSLNLGKFDIIWGGMNVTVARGEQVDFTQAYYEAPAVIVAAKDSKINLITNNAQKLCPPANTEVGTQGGNTFASYLKENCPHVDIKSYPSVQSAFIDLQSGRVNAVMTDKPTAQYWLQKHHDYTIIGHPIQDQQYFHQGYAIAVKKGNKALLQQLNNAITALKRAGKIQMILHQYHFN